MAKDFVNITDTFNLVSHSTHKGGHTWSSFMFFSQLVMQCSLIMFLCYLKFLFPVPQFFLNMFDCLCFSYLCLYHSWTALSCSLWAPVYPLYCFTTSLQIQPLPAASGHLHSTPALRRHWGFLGGVELTPAVVWQTVIGIMPPTPLRLSGAAGWPGRGSGGLLCCCVGWGNCHA